MSRIVPEPITRWGGRPESFQCGVGEYVDRIGGDEENSLGVVPHYLGDDLAPDGGVFLYQVEAGLAGLLTGSCGKHRDDRSGAVGVGCPPIRGWDG